MESETFAETLEILSTLTGLIDGDKYRRIQSSPPVLYTLPNTITLNHCPAAIIYLPKYRSMQTFALANNSHPVF
jgi:hypothetical protein